MIIQQVPIGEINLYLCEFNSTTNELKYRISTEPKKLIITHCEFDSSHVLFDEFFIHTNFLTKLIEDGNN
jgi:hypothetical protein